MWTGPGYSSWKMPSEVSHYFDFFHITPNQVEDCNETKILFAFSWHCHRPPTKLREGNVFSRVCLSVIGLIGLHHTGTPLSTCPLLLDMGTHWTSGGLDWRPFQTCPLEDPPPVLPSGGYWRTYCWQAWPYASYWSTALLVMKRHEYITSCMLIAVEFSLTFERFFLFISGETHRRVALNRDFCTFQPDVKYKLPLKALSRHDAYDWH